MQPALFAIATIATAFLTAFAALYLFSFLDQRKESRLRKISEAERDSVVFIFENETLLDATPAARQLLDTAPRSGTVWAHLASLLGPRFPHLSDRMRDLADLGQIELRSSDGSSRLKAEWYDGVARLTLVSDIADAPASGVDKHSLAAMTQELETLRATANQTPYALWREASDGTVTWCNAAYLAIADRIDPSADTASWPPPRLFDTTPDPSQADSEGSDKPSHRVAIDPDGGDARQWFDVSRALLPGGDWFCAALPADALVKAETTLKEFVTTLSKTFAALPIGLAIFDRARELALFNPALMDLTMLPADFLIARPGLSSFLDKLREARMIPEPKDYKSWRRQMSDLVAAAQNGSYEETWSLPTGQTYRVTGRPHPDGAVALLFEDISAEVSVARRFRAEIETGQAALDALPQAIAVFTPGGVMSLSNNAYAELWGTDPSSTLEQIYLGDALRAWAGTSAPNPVWDHLRAFSTKLGPRETWTARLTLLDGRALGLTVSPLAGGSMMVSFSGVIEAPTLRVPAERPAPATALGL